MTVSRNQLTVAPSPADARRAMLRPQKTLSPTTLVRVLVWRVTVAARLLVPVDAAVRLNRDSVCELMQRRFRWAARRQAKSGQ